MNVAPCSSLITKLKKMNLRFVSISLKTDLFCRLVSNNRLVFATAIKKATLPS